MSDLTVKHLGQMTASEIWEEIVKFQEAIAALMAERRAMRSVVMAASGDMISDESVSRARFLDLCHEQLRLVGLARLACRAAGIELENYVGHYPDQSQRG